MAGTKVAYADRIVLVHTDGQTEVDATNPLPVVIEDASFEASIDLATLEASTGAVGDAAVTNPASSASVIAALKGIMTAVNNAATSLAIVDDWDKSDGIRLSETRVSKTLTLSLNTSGAYANGELLADTQVIDAAFRQADGTGILEGIQVLDEDDQTAYSFDAVLLDANVSLGTENTAPGPTDADARNILGVVRFATTDSIDLGNSKLYYKQCNIPVKALSGTDDIAIAFIINTGTPTHTASGITIRLFIRQD